MSPAEDDRYETGLRIQREILGPERLEAIVEKQTDFTMPLHDFVTRVAWGDVWARPGLDRRMRSTIAIAVLAALGCREEVGIHARLGRANGLTEEEIAEILLQTGVYAGVARAHAAFASVQEALDADADAGGDPAAER